MRQEVAGGSPGERDVVISPHAGHSGWNVRQVPGAAQLLYATRQEALRAGRQFAHTQHVRVWYCDEHQCTRLLEGYSDDTSDVHPGTC
jgi:Uncharacterized protein conserved in bacteria (DUF2188)